MSEVENVVDGASEGVVPLVESNRRRVFRLRFPDSATLKATIGGREYEVMEIAEFSMLLNAVSVKTTAGKCEGTIVWSDSRKLDFVGCVGPIYDQERLVIWKINGITMEDIISEQRRLLKKYSVSSVAHGRKTAG